MTPSRILSSLRRRFRKPAIERRLRICDMGSIFPEDKTEWSTDPEDPAAWAFREKHSDLRVLDHCPTASIDWDLHQRHIITEERQR